MTKFHVGVQLQPMHCSWAGYAGAARAVEDLGVDSIWTWDHFFPLSGDPNGLHFEGWTSLTAFASLTSRPELGCLVTCNSYRNPSLLTHMAKTIDHISGGRLILGIGSGWFQHDYDSFGYEFGTVNSRLRDLERDLPIIRRRMAAEVPPPLRNPMPLLIGGAGEKFTLRLVARHADMWNSFGPPEKWARKSRILDEWCVKEGRDPAEIARTVAIGAHEVTTATLEAFAEAGATHFILSRSTPWDYEPLEALLRWRG